MADALERERGKFDDNRQAAFDAAADMSEAHKEMALQQYASRKAKDLGIFSKFIIFMMAGSFLFFFALLCLSYLPGAEGVISKVLFFL